LSVFGQSIALTGLTVLGALLIGVPLAVLTAYVKLPAQRLWLVLLSAPLAMPSYIRAFTFYAAFGPGGEVEQLLGLPTPDMRGLLGAAVVMTLYTFPFVLLTTRASLRSLDASVLDAARTLGLSLPGHSGVPCYPVSGAGSPPVRCWWRSIRCRISARPPLWGSIPLPA